MNRAYLVLENGRVFEGGSFGAEPESGCGELVFTTGMGGYLETLTDPSYCGQIIIQTFPMIGNYGVIPDEFESEKCHASGYVVRELCGAPSNFRSGGTLGEFLKKQGVPGISGVDTRELTRLLRSFGVMKACIATSPEKVVFKRAASVNQVPFVSVKSPKTVGAVGAERYNVALLDFGAKAAISRNLSERGARVTLLPHDTTAEKILSGGYDGLLLSNGPGDPADNSGCIRELSKLLGRIPIFGICLGHQLLALAAGARTGKLKFGHRGANQPVKDLRTGRVYITSQNHGYEVLARSLSGTPGRVSHINANDGSVEGAEYPGLSAFSVQFHPEACAGPLDTSFLFDKFFNILGSKSSPGEV